MATLLSAVSMILHDVLVIKHWHNSYIIQPCGASWGLATMEVKNELMHEISLFWKLFNEISSHITERGYTFNPKAIMVDKNDANYCAIRQVFGLHFMISKVENCHMH